LDLSSMLARAKPAEEFFAPDHLVASVSSVLAPVDYERDLGRALLGELTTTGVAFVICRPAGNCYESAPPPWAVLCERAGRTLTLAIAETRLFPFEADPRVRRSTAFLDRPTFHAVEAAWRTMLRGTRNTDRMDPGTDRYIFGFVKPVEPVMTGETWATDTDTAAGRLVRMCLELREYILADEAARPPLAQRLLKQALWFAPPPPTT